MVLSGPPPPSAPPRRPTIRGSRGLPFRDSLVLIKKGSYQRDVSGHVVVDSADYPVEVDQDPIAFRGWLQPSPTTRRTRETGETQLGDDESDLAFTSHILFAPPTLPALKNDRIKRDPDDGITYVIAVDPEDAGGVGHHLEIQLVEYRYEAALP